MPPGQPVYRCQNCRLLRPCKEWSGEWLCVECAPVEVEEDAVGQSLEVDDEDESGATDTEVRSAVESVATDGGVGK